MADSEEIGYFAAGGANFREDLFGPLQRGRYGAFNDFLVDTQCVLLGALEAGSRAGGLDGLANGWSFARGFNGCYPGPPPPATKQLPDPAFFGGQCPGSLYRAEISVRINGGAPQFRGNATFGPVSSISIEPGLSGTNRQAVVMRGKTLLGGDSRIQFISGLDNQTLSDLQILEFGPEGGDPDDCGNGAQGTPQYPPGEDLPSPPNNGDVIAPGRDIVVPVDTGGGTADLGVNIGDATYCFSGSVCISVDGIPHRIKPDGGIDKFPTSPGGASDPPTDGESLDQIQDSVDAELSGDLSWMNCDGELETQSYLGSGLFGVEALMKTLLLVVNAGVSEYCALLEEDEFEGAEVASSQVTESEIDSFLDITLNVEAKRVEVDVEGSSNPYSVRRGAAQGNDNEQGRFAVISLLEEVDGNDLVKWTENQYYSKAIYDVGVDVSRVRKIRVSLRAGSAAQVKEYK